MSETAFLPITRLPAGGVSPAVIVCGDPARADRIAARLTGAALLSENREYRAYRGHYQGLAVTVCSHGVGAPGAAPAFEELIAAGATHLLRVGTCGGMQPELGAGDLVIGAAAVQHTGYGLEVAPAGYPAVADPALTLALAAAAPAARRGIVLTRDSFYQGAAPQRAVDYQALSAAQVLAVEMECAALFLVGSLRGAATGAILTVDGNVLQAPEDMDSYAPHRAIVGQGVERAIDAALAALRATLGGEARS
jgi:uridine phosphorylase